MPAFLPAARLCADFYADVLAPALAGLTHAAGLLGTGSDVLGYDTERSTDHDWGPRASVFVDEGDVEEARSRVARALPESYRGWPVRFGRDGQPPSPHVSVDVWGRWLEGHLGVDPTAGLTPLDWLVVPQQRLLEMVAGPVFADPRGELAAVRHRLAWYPDDVWWWLLACQWHRLAQEEPFVQRTAEVGDHVGSAVLAGRLVRDVVRLALLQARRYAPYSKWLGTAFGRLDGAERLRPHLSAAIAATTLPQREAALSAAYEGVARRHAALPGTTALEASVRPFYDRPALVLDAGRFTADCLRRVEDPWLLGLPLIGSVDCVVDNTDVLVETGTFQRLRALYRP